VNNYEQQLLSGLPAGKLLMILDNNGYLGIGTILGNASLCCKARIWISTDVLNYQFVQVQGVLIF
jgi:hypothetical protein